MKRYVFENGNAFFIRKIDILKNKIALKRRIDLDRALVIFNFLVNYGKNPFRARKGIQNGIELLADLRERALKTSR